MAIWGNKKYTTEIALLTKSSNPHHLCMWAFRRVSDFTFLMDHLHWWSLLAKLLVTSTHNSHMAVLTLVTLGVATQIGSFLFMSRCLKWPRKVIVGIITLNFANVNLY